MPTLCFHKNKRRMVKMLKRVISIAMVLTMALGIFGISASATKASPVSFSVETSDTTCGYAGLVTVTVTFRNTTGKDIKNIVITSSGSKGLCMYRPIKKNVLITNDGYWGPMKKSDAMTECLKPGGTIKYVYCALLGYQYSKRLVPEATRVFMLKQHRLLRTKDFRPINIKSGSSVKQDIGLMFGDVATNLNVKAYYNVSNSAYEKIAEGSSVNEAKASESTTASEKKTTASRTTVEPAAAKTPSRENSGGASDSAFVYNSATNKFHKMDCEHVEDMNSDNIEVLRNISYQGMLEKGYSPCQDCLG